MTKRPFFRERVEAKPDVTTLREEFYWAVQHRDSGIFRRQRTNYNTRYCIWANQSSDGKKWSAPRGQEIFPWPGASDARVSLVDMYINEDVAKLMVIWRRMRTLVNGTESSDAAFGVRLTQLLRWMKYVKMKEAPREMRYLANLFFERGSAVLGVFWEKRRQLGYDTLDVEDLKGMAMEAMKFGQAPNGLDLDKLNALAQTIYDPSQEKLAAGILAELYPDVDASRMRKVVADLRTTGSARFPRPYVVKDQPMIVALASNEDIFAPPETTELQTARALHRREFLTETALLDRIESAEWDKDWVEEVIETQRGRVTTDFEGNLFRGSTSRVNGRGQLNTTKLYEVIHTYRRLHDSDRVPGIYYDCFSPGVVSGVGYHTLLDYDHGQYPFVHFERETRSRLLDDSRGYGEIASTWQQQIKTEWDSRIDRASIATLPPSYYPPGEAPDSWGPGVKVPTNRPNDYGFMAKPEYDVGSERAEESVHKFAARYFGRVVEQENVMEAQVQQQDLGDIWMGHCAEADEQILQLMQQYLPDQIFYRVVGSTKSKPLHATRDEIQGEFDVAVTYNVADLDQEQVKKKMDMIETMLQMDTTGRVDRDEVLTVVGELVDPNLGERILKPGEEASAAEVKDEKMNYALMYAGIGTDVSPGGGQAYTLRLQVLQNILKTNPEAQRKYQQDPNFRTLVDKRLKQLQFIGVTEPNNARIGALGA